MFPVIVVGVVVFWIVYFITGGNVDISLVAGFLSCLIWAFSRRGK